MLHPIHIILMEMSHYLLYANVIHLIYYITYLLLSISFSLILYNFLLYLSSLLYILFYFYHIYISECYLIIPSYLSFPQNSIIFMQMFPCSLHNCYNSYISSLFNHSLLLFHILHLLIHL